MKTLVLTFAAFAALTTGAIAAPGQAKSAVKKAALVCPVTGTKIASIKDAVGHSTYKGKTYYFCCPDCKPRFDKNPAKIVASAAKGHYEKM